MTGSVTACSSDVIREKPQTVYRLIVMASRIRPMAGACALDGRQRSVLARVADAERAAMLALPTADPRDAERRRRVEATRDELLAQPAVVDRNLAGNHEALDEAARMIAGRELDRAFLVGAGDSLAVMAAARIVLEAMLGVPCEPVPERMMQIAFSCWSSARERKKRSIEVAMPERSTGPVKRNMPPEMVMYLLGGRI